MRNYAGLSAWAGRQIGSIDAQQAGFFIWILSGLLLVAWGDHPKARAIMLINSVNESDGGLSAYGADLTDSSLTARQPW